MKYRFYFFLGIAMLLLFSCKKERATVNENQIGFNKCQAFTIDGKTITCCLDSVIQDSRCPINALCIWDGIAVARFKVHTQNSDHIIALAIRKFPPYSKDTTLAGFKIEFTNLLPHGQLNKPFNYSNYVAEVNVTRP